MITEVQTVSYRLDASLSRFTVQAFATGILSYFAHSPTFAIGEFAGEVGFTPDTFANSWCWLTVKADSLQLVDRVRPEDRAEIETRMRQEVLQAERYPEITFGAVDFSAQSLSAGGWRVRLAGQLTLRDVRKPLIVDAELHVQDNQIRLAGEFVLRQSDYGIRPVTALAGAIRLEDRLAFTFDMLGHKEETPPTAQEDS